MLFASDLDSDVKIASEAAWQATRRATKLGTHDLALRAHAWAAMLCSAAGNPTGAISHLAAKDRHEALMNKTFAASRMPLSEAARGLLSMARQAAKEKPGTEVEDHLEDMARPYAQGTGHDADALHDAACKLHEGKQFAATSSGPPTPYSKARMAALNKSTTAQLYFDKRTAERAAVLHDVAAALAPHESLVKAHKDQAQAWRDAARNTGAKRHEAFDRTTSSIHFPGEEHNWYKQQFAAGPHQSYVHAAALAHIASRTARLLQLAWHRTHGKIGTPPVAAHVVAAKAHHQAQSAAVASGMSGAIVRYHGAHQVKHARLAKSLKPTVGEAKLFDSFKPASPMEAAVYRSSLAWEATEKTLKTSPGAKHHARALMAHLKAAKAIRDGNGAKEAASDHDRQASYHAEQVAKLLRDPGQFAASKKKDPRAKAEEVLLAAQMKMLRETANEVYKGKRSPRIGSFRYGKR